MDLNDTVTVTLTAKGAEILNKENEEIAKRVPSYNWKTDYKDGDEYRTQLWSLFGHFGAYCYAGGQHCFNDLQPYK